MNGNLMKCFVFLAFLLACNRTHPAPSSSGNASNAQTGATSSTSTNTSKLSSSSGPGNTSPTGSNSSVVPNFQSVDAGGLNSLPSVKANLKPAADSKKVFLVQRVNSYRPVWLNLTLNPSDTSGFWAAVSKFGTAVNASFVGDYTKAAFSTAPQPAKASVSIYQPMTDAGGTDEKGASVERGDSFKTIGHTFSQTLQFPTFPSAIISLYMIPSTDPRVAALAPPIAYTKVYYRAGPASSDLLQACTNVNNAAKKESFPSSDDLAKCQEVQAGGSDIFDFLNVQMGGNTTTGVGALNTFFQMQTAVVWQPVPPSGYQCLGQIVTNTTDMPQTSADAGGIYAQNQQTISYDSNGNISQTASWDYPVYCVQQKYLEEGQLQAVISNGGADFYTIRAKDSTGYGDSNLFYAVPTNMSDTDRKALKVWVLNKNFVRFLPDVDVTNAGTGTSTGTRTVH